VRLVTKSEPRAVATGPRFNTRATTRGQYPKMLLLDF
jgi:hypothetical protein